MYIVDSSIVFMKFLKIIYQIIEITLSYLKSRACLNKRLNSARFLKFFFFIQLDELDQSGRTHWVFQNA